MTKYINRSKTLPEVFEEVRSLSSVEEKAEHLAKYKTKSLAFYVNALYNLEWGEVEVPEFVYNTHPPGIAYASIHSSIEQLNAIHRLRNSNPKRAKEILHNVLESVTREEADLIVNLIKGKRVEGINKAVFKRVYPEFFRHKSEAEES